MTRRSVGLAAGAALAVALALGACPLPQPLPEVGKVDGGTTVTPPRILADSVTPADALLQVQRGCPGGAQLTFTATVRDDNTLEQVDARWFVDYAPVPPGSLPYRSDVLPAPEDSTQTDRALAPFVLALPESDPQPVHVLELAVSNGFYALYDPAAPLPNLSAQPGFEVQLFRWFIEYVDAPGGRCQYP